VHALRSRAAELEAAVAGLRTSLEANLLEQKHGAAAVQDFPEALARLAALETLTLTLRQQHEAAAALDVPLALARLAALEAAAEASAAHAASGVAAAAQLLERVAGAEAAAAAMQSRAEDQAGTLARLESGHAEAAAAGAAAAAAAAVRLADLERAVRDNALWKVGRPLTYLRRLLTDMHSQSAAIVERPAGLERRVRK